MLATLIEALHDVPRLLVLDNCEHLLDACAHLADTLLRACPRLRILATSRHLLGIAGEMTIDVPPLPTPPLAPPLPLADLAQCEAVRLFVERASARRPTFGLVPANAASIARVCRRLDGLPLAIELAAARVRVLSVEQIAERLDDRFHLLSDGGRTALPQHQTLRAAVDWSYALLSSEEQRLLCRLASFAGGFPLAAAEAVGPDEDLPHGEILDVLTHLVDKSLVTIEDGDGAVRYHLLETIREYAQQRLVEAGEWEVVRNRQRAWVLALAEAAAPALHGADRARWLSRLEPERDNLRAALAWCVERDPDTGLDLLAHLEHFWVEHRAEALQWLTATLAAGPGDPSSRAIALVSAGCHAYYLGDHAASRVHLEEAAALARVLDDQGVLGRVLHYQGHLAETQDNDPVRAIALLEKSRELLQQVGDIDDMRATLRCLGSRMTWKGEYDRSQELLEHSLELGRAMGAVWTIAMDLLCLGVLAAARGDTTRAAALYTEGLAHARATGSGEGRSLLLSALAGLAQQQGDDARAQALLEESAALHRAVGNRKDLGGALVALATLARRRGDFVRAHTLLEERRALPYLQGERLGVADVLRQLGKLAFAEGHLAAAAERFEESLRLAREADSALLMGLALGDLAQLAHRRGESGRAHTLWQDSLVALREHGPQLVLARVWGNLGAVVIVEGEPARGVRLLSAALAAQPAFWTASDPPERASCAAALAAAWAALGEESFAAAWDAGTAMSTEQAMRDALRAL